MSGHHPFSELVKDFSEERRRKIEGMKSKLLSELPITNPTQAGETADEPEG